MLCKVAALPLSCKCREHSQLLILECKRGLQSPRVGILNVLCSFKHPQQIKCTCISLEFATVQLICGTWPFSPRPVHPAGSRQSLVSLENTYHTHARRRTPALCPFPSSWNSVLSYGSKDALNSLICGFSPQGWGGCKRKLFQASVSLLTCQ